jgi:iron complex transport system substrate-binding protein
MVAGVCAAASLFVFASASSAYTVTPAHFCLVSLSPTATETLYAIGAGPNVRAVDTDSNYPVTGLPKLRINPFNPSAEQIATICKVTSTHPSPKPDLVVVAYDANSIVENLTTLGVHVILQDAPANLAGAYAQIAQLGKLTGHSLVASHVLYSIRHTIAADVASVPPHPHRVVNVFYELDPTLYSLTSSTFVGQLLTMLGAKNIADAVASPSDDGYPQLNAEYVISANPKLVYLADTICCHVTAATWSARPGFSVISASRFHHIHGLNDDIASRWGPRLGILMNSLTYAVKATLADPRPWR